MLYKTNIGAGRTDELWKFKSGYAFFIFDLKCYFRSSYIQVFWSGLKSNNVEYNEVT